MSVAVIGAGVMGLATAWHLNRRGIETTLYDAGLSKPPGSWAAGGLLSPLPPDLKHSDIEQFFFPSLEKYPAWLQGIERASKQTINYSNCGLLWQQPKGVQQFIDWVAQVNSRQLVAALRTALKVSGVDCIAQDVHRLWIEEGCCKGLYLDATQQPFSSVVVAAGAWSQQLSEQLGSEKVVEPIHGQVLELHAPNCQLTHALFNGEHYVVPQPGHRFWVGSTLENVGLSHRVSKSGQDSLWQAACDMEPQFKRASITFQWSGLRAKATQDKAWVGPHETVSGLFFNTGHYRLGISMAPESAKTVVNAVLKHCINEKISINARKILK